jgi:hypothetical protein
MAYYALGNPSVSSTGAAFVADPSTATLVAELDSTRLGTAHFLNGQSKDFRITSVVGGNASTNVQWLIEHTLSTGLGSTAIRNQFGVFTPAGQSAQYVWQWRAEKDSRFRVRVNSSVAGTVAANLQAEPLD